MMWVPVSEHVQRTTYQKHLPWPDIMTAWMSYLTSRGSDKVFGTNKLPSQKNSVGVKRREKMPVHNMFCQLSRSGGSGSKESSCSTRDPGLIPCLERFPGEGNDYPLQSSCLENSTDRGFWWATVHGVLKSWTQLSD